MLKIKGVSKVIDERISIDEYLPIEIEWGETGIAHPINWRIGDFRKSLLEIGIDPTSQIIRSLTMPICESIIIDKDIQNEAIISHEGIPVFETDKWPTNGILDENIKFEFHLGHEYICIRITNCGPTIKRIVSGKVKFGIDVNDSLCEIEIEIDKVALKTIKTALNLK